MVGSLVLGRTGYGENGHVKGIEGSVSSALWNQEASGGETGREVEGRPWPSPGSLSGVCSPMERALFSVPMPLIAVHGAFATVGMETLHIPVPTSIPTRH